MKKNNAGMLAIGLAAGMLIGAPTAQAAAEYLKALPSTSAIYVDGRQVELEAYMINGANYVKLRDIGQAVGFNVFWQDGVQIDTDAPYTGEAPAETETQAEQIPQVNTGTADQPDLESTRQRMIALTNELRREHSIAALTANDKLMEAAQVRAEEMAATSTYSHTRPDGSGFYTVTNCPNAAENIHRVADWQLTDADLADTSISSWENTESHRKHLLNGRLAEVGIGLARGVNAGGDDCWYCVQLFLYGGQTVTWVGEAATGR